MALSRVTVSGPTVPPDGSVTTAKLADLAVDTGKIADNAVTADKLADDAVDTAAIQDGAVTSEKINDNAIRESAIQDDAVTTTKIYSGAVTGEKIANDAVTENKIADNAVTNDKIADGNIEPYHFAAEAVETAAIADEAVTTAKLAAGAVTEAKLADSAVTAAKINDGAVTNAKVNSIVYAKISDPPTIPALSDAAGAALGSAAAGVAVTAARGDHVHATPTAGAVGAVPVTAYTGKGAVLGASAPSTPAVANNAVEGGMLRKTDEESSGIEWAAGFGYPARLVTTTSGPFDLTNNDAFTVKCKTGNGEESITITVTTGDVVSIDAVTPAEIVALVEASAATTWAARVRSDGKLEIYCSSVGRGTKLPNNPFNYLRLTAISASMQTAFGWSVDQFGYGSGAVPASVTSVNAAPFAPAGGETLSLEVDGSAVTSDALQVGDTTAALVASRLAGSAEFVAAGVLAYASGNNVILQLADGSAEKTLQVTGGTANTDLAFPTTVVTNDPGVFDSNLALMQELGEVITTILFYDHGIMSLGTSSGAIVLDMLAGAVQNLTINADASFTAENVGNDYEFSFTVQIFITASGGTRNVSFDSDWKWIGSKPTSIASGVTGCLTLTNRGPADTDVVASYAVLGAG